MKDVNKSIAVVGAGVAGMAAARVLKSAGFNVVVYEKSRGLGGRCATKRWEEHVVDHGAQYFTVRGEDFRLALAAAELCELRMPIVDEAGKVLTGDARYYLRSGNSRLARVLGDGLDVRTGIELSPSPERTFFGETFDAVVSTAPLPQTRRLAGMEAGASDYVPCLTLLLVYDGRPDGVTTQRYAVSDRSGHALAWSACENHKTGHVEGDVSVFVAQAGEDFSREYLEADSEVWAAKLRLMVEERWELMPDRVLKSHAHRWRFARVKGTVPLPDLPNGWFFAGDAATESRVESAWEAGRDVGRRVALFLAE